MLAPSDGASPQVGGRYYGSVSHRIPEQAVNRFPAAHSGEIGG